MWLRKPPVCRCHSPRTEQYLADFTAAVKKAQQTPFLRGEGARGWRASFDWFIANHVNIYGVLEGKYDGPAATPNNGNGGSHGGDRYDVDCDRAALPPGGRAGEIPSTFPASEQACGICGGTGWRRAEGEEFIGLRRCECVRARIRETRLAAIPEQFRESTFESYRPRNPRQERTLDLMRGDPGGSFYLNGAYGSGKTHLLPH